MSIDRTVVGRVLRHRPAALIAAIVLVGTTIAFAQGLTVQDFKSNRPTPRMANGKPDFSGYWKGTTDTKPGGNIGKDLRFAIFEAAQGKILSPVDTLLLYCYHYDPVGKKYAIAAINIMKGVGAVVLAMLVVLIIALRKQERGKA